MNWKCFGLTGWILLALGSVAYSAVAAPFTKVYIDPGAAPSTVETNIAGLLQARLQAPAGLEVEVGSTSGVVPSPAPGVLRILLGLASRHEVIGGLIEKARMAPLSDRDPGPEGFLLYALPESDSAEWVVAGVDERGLLYGVGALLRAIEIGEEGVTVPEKFKERSAPAFMVRGTEFGQSHVAKRLAQVRDWTREETERAILDYALAGANVFSDNGPYFDFLRSYGLMAQGGFGANTGSGPPEWEASESIGRTGYVCLSVPDAVAAQLERFEAFAQASPALDFLKFHGGDGGGCECDRCKPYGLTFIQVVEQMAGIWHRIHPETRIYFTNQKFDNEDDQAIFAYLQEQPRAWLWAWGYGPGSDAMSWQPGHRQNHRMDLFRYPGFGPFARYNQEILHQLPPQQVLVHFNEITHWRYSQHGYVQMYPRADRDGNLPPHWNHFIYERRPDQALTMVYDRLTFYAWPRFYHWLFGEVVRYGVGDITHSSGHHDHFNQWMWQRLLWNPQQTVEEVVASYCHTWFGPEAAPLMAEALFLMEQYLEEDPARPLTEKAEIRQYLALVKEGGEVMSASRMASSWLWREYMQKGLLDRYTQLAVALQSELQSRIEEHIATAIKEGAVDEAIAASLEWLDGAWETEEMAGLREEAGRLGEESNALYGVRSEGYFNLEHDFIGLGWLRRQLERAASARGAERDELLHMIVAYDDPGEGGFYDNLGTANMAPHVVFGYPYDHGQPYVSEMLSEGNRPSQRSMHFSQDESQGVTLDYRDLDPAARYRVRFTFVRPWYQERYAFRMNQRKQHIYANDQLIAADVELPLQMSEHFSFDIPEALTADGSLVIRLKKSEGVAEGDRVSIEQWRNSGGWGTLVSEVWLMKR